MGLWHLIGRRFLSVDKTILLIGLVLSVACTRPSNQADSASSPQTTTVAPSNSQEFPPPTQRNSDRESEFSGASNPFEVQPIDENFKLSVRQKEWVEQSARREKELDTYTAIFHDELCEKLKGQKPLAFKEAPTLRFTAKILATKPADGGALGIFVAEPSKGGSSTSLTSYLQTYFEDYARVSHCEGHTSVFREAANSSEIESTVTVGGVSGQGLHLQDTLRMKLSFNRSTQAIEDFELLRGYRTSTRKPIFVDRSENLLPSDPNKDSDGAIIRSNFGTFLQDDLGGLSIVDIDDDGHLEIYVPTPSRNLLYKRDRAGVFREVAQAWGIDDAGNSRHGLFVDLDDDHDLDLIVVNMALEGISKTPVQFYRRDPQGFTNITRTAVSTPVVGAYSQAAASDVDNDGDLDIFIVARGNELSNVPNHFVEADNGEPNILLMNQGGFRFKDETKKRGLEGKAWSYAAAFADYDEDGDDDLIVANEWSRTVFYENQGAGDFVDKSVPFGLNDPGAGMGVVWADFNQDLRLDIYLSNMFSNAGSRIIPYATLQNESVKNALHASTQGNSLYLNLGKGKFEQVAQRYGVHEAGWAWGSSAFDYDRDGDLDLYVANGFQSGESPGDF